MKNAEVKMTPLACRFRQDGLGIFPDSGIEAIIREERINPLAASTLRLLNKTEPVRRVGGGRNVVGRFQSPIMGCSIQFEARTTELSFLWIHHFRAPSRFIIDQPCSIRLRYSLPSGRPAAFDYTPDFFCVGSGIAELVECKTAKELEHLVDPENPRGQPWRYKRLPSGAWTSPPAQIAAAQHGLEFRIFSSSDVNPTLVNNLEFLSDYFFPSEPNEEIDTKIKEAVSANPGISIRELVDKLALSGTEIDRIYFLVAGKSLFADIDHEPIAPNYTARLFQSREHALALGMTDESRRVAVLAPPILNFQVGSEIQLTNRRVTIIDVNQNTAKIASNGEVTEMDLRALASEAENTSANSPAKTLEGASARAGIARVSSEELARALARYASIKSLLGTSRPRGTSRNQRRLLRKFRAAEQLHGCGLLGLIDAPRPGNRTSRLDSRVVAIMWEALPVYLNKIAPTGELFWGEILRRCADLVPPARGPSLQTIHTFLKKLDPVKVATDRIGPKAAYQLSGPEWEDEWDQLAINGDHAWASAHIDHTQLDVTTAALPDGLMLGRPWLTLMVSPKHRRVLAFALSFEEPSYRSCLAVIRDCVRRHNRLPGFIVVDNGAEFNSTYFEQLLAGCHAHKKSRPASRPRFGAVLERMNLTLNTTLFHSLPGNTKVTKNVRMVDKQNAPESHAKLSLADLYEILETYIFDELDLRPDQITGENPRDRFESDRKFGGAREHMRVLYDDTFRLLTLPTSRKGTVTISREGVRHAGNVYWCSALRDTSTRKLTVPFRYDPDDFSHVYIYLNGGWREAKCRLFQERFRGLTEKEVQAASIVLRSAVRNFGYARRVKKAERLARFFATKNLTPGVVRLRERAAQSKKLRPAAPTVREAAAVNGAKEIEGALTQPSLPPKREPKKYRTSYRPHNP